MTEKASEELRVLREKIDELEKEREELRLRLQRLNRKPSNLIAYIILPTGLASLIFSSTIFSAYESSSNLALISTFIGLSLTFWGALLLYIKPTSYVKASILDSTAMPNLIAINRILTDLNYKGKGIYLPPKHLKEFKSATIYIPQEDTETIPPIEETTQEKFFLNPNGICLTPSGLGLTNLYENMLGIDFAKTDLRYLQRKLPKLFIESLEIAEDLEIKTHSNQIHIKITKSIYQNLCTEARKLPNICHTFGCPLCSSIAIALTRTTGKPITIVEDKPDPEEKTIEIHYKIIEE